MNTTMTPTYAAITFNEPAAANDEVNPVEFDSALYAECLAESMNDSGPTPPVSLLNLPAINFFNATGDALDLS